MRLISLFLPMFLLLCNVANAAFVNDEEFLDVVTTNKHWRYGLFKTDSGCNLYWITPTHPEGIAKSITANKIRVFSPCPQVPDKDTEWRMVYFSYSYEEGKTHYDFYDDETNLYLKNTGKFPDLSGGTVPDEYDFIQISE